MQRGVCACTSCVLRCTRACVCWVCVCVCVCVCLCVLNLLRLFVCACVFCMRLCTCPCYVALPVPVLCATVRICVMSAASPLPRFGTRVFPASGDAHEGEYLRGVRHGRGVYVWRNGTRYSGDWVDGVPEGASGRQGDATCDVCQCAAGTGAFVWPDGASYEGDVADGAAGGRGVKVFGEPPPVRVCGGGVCVW